MDFSQLVNPSYYLAASSQLGWLGWSFVLIQVAGVAAGLYLMFVRRESNALRRTLLYQLSIALLVIGGIGVLLGVLRLANVPVFNQRYWFYLQLLVELGLAAYIVYYVRSVYPALMAQSQSSRGKGGARRDAARSLSSQAHQNGTAGPVPPRPVATTSRREARRDRKRKGR